MKEALDKLPDNDIIAHMKQQYKRLKDNELKGMLSFDEINRETNKIANALLSYLSDDHFFHSRKVF